MATITLQVAETGFATLTKTYTLPDSEVDRVVVAHQIAANASVNGPATRTQVLNYWASTVMASLKSYVLSAESLAAVAALPAVTPINPV